MFNLGIMSLLGPVAEMLKIAFFGLSATNVEYASGDSILETLVLHVLPDFHGEHGDGILNTNSLTAALRAKGAVEIVEGGLEAWAGITKAENDNAQWQGKNADMRANAQDPNARLRWDWKIFTNAVVISDLDKARVKGRAMMKNYAQTLRKQAEITTQNAFNSAWWASTPATDEPQSVPSLVSATPTTGTIGGLSRSGNAYLQNGAYTDAIGDIGSEAGISDIHKLRILQSVGTSMPDLIVMGSAKYANLAAYLETKLRYRPNEALREQRIDSLELGVATVIFENTNVLGGANTIDADYVYGLNTKFMFLKTLRDGNAVWEKGFERIGTKLNRALFFKWFGNLITNTPRAHFVATNVTT